MLLDELRKPKAKQRLSEDLFIEMEKALTTVERAMPEVVPDKDVAADALLQKYKGGVFDNIVDLRRSGRSRGRRKWAPIGRAAQAALRKLFSSATYSIDEAFEDTVSGVYAERDIVSRIEGVDRAS